MFYGYLLGEPAFEPADVDSDGIVTIAGGTVLVKKIVGKN